MSELVPFKIAKKLKEKGFKEQCLAYYTKDSDFYYNTSYGSDIEDAFKSFNSRPNHICGKRIDAPTISQVLKWLREEKKLYILLTDVSIRGNIEWDFQIDDLNTSDIIYESRLIYSSYEEAAFAGIEYAINNLI